MTVVEIVAVLSGAAVVIGQLASSFVLLSKARQDAADSRADRQHQAERVKQHLDAQDVKLVALHESTNGLSRRNEEIARQLGRLQGAQAQKDNPE